MKVLIVDDDNDMRRILRYLIEHHGHEAMEAENGADGLSKASILSPDLIISGILMPQMDGFQFLRKLKSDSKLKSIPFIFYSAIYTDKQEKEFAKTLGAIAFITRPKEPNDVWNEVTAALEASRTGKIKTQKTPPVEKEEFLDRYGLIVANKLKEKVHELQKEIGAHKLTVKKLSESEKKLALANEELRLLHTLSLSVSEAEDFDSGIRRVADIVCQKTNWPYSEVWIPHSDYISLEHSASYQKNDPSINKFMESSMDMKFPYNTGMPGYIWAEKRPLWIEDLAAAGQGFLRAQSAATAGLRAAIGMPIVSEGKALAAFIFFLREVSDNDKRLADILIVISAQLGGLFQRKLNSESRRKLQQRYESLINNINVGVYWVDEQRNFIEANPAMAAIVGADSKEKLLRHPMTDFFIDKDRAVKLGEKIAKEGFFKDEEIAIMTLKGAQKWCSLSATANVDRGDGACCDCILEDITEKKKKDEQLRRLHRIEAVGKLSGAIAHQFNNILTAIIGYSTLLQMKRSDDALVKEYINHLLALSDRAALLTHGMLAFSRKEMLNLTIIDMSDFLKGVEAEVSKILGKDIGLKIKPAQKALKIIADPEHMKRIFSNLASNARDAMPNGGTVAISSETAVIDHAFINSHNFGKEGRYALIIFSDSGIGMDEKIKEKMFEPFFTTKEIGRGVGLGLSAAYGLIKQHNGYIDVDSAPGKGAAFKYICQSLSRN